MGYWRIKKSTFAGIIISALLGMIISLISVLYLVHQNRLLSNTIENLINHKVIMQSYNEIIEDTESVMGLEEESQKIENNVIAENVQASATMDDRELLAKLLYCEGRGESIECQRAIISVVVNRLNNGYWGNTFRSVIYAKGQFSPVSEGSLEKAKPSQTQYDVVDYVLENGSTLPSWVMYFRASYHFSWKGYTPYCNIDNTYFGGYKK